MRAVVLEGNARLSVREVARPKLDKVRPVLVRIAAAGVCGSDIPRGFEGKAYHYPLIMGHELSGVVEEGGQSFSPGERVVVFPLIPCLKCASCSVGEFSQCVDYDFLGSRSDGGFTEFVKVPERNVFRIPEHLDITHAALTEPTAVALHAVNKLDLPLGATVAVIGGGPIGLLAAQWLQSKGCEKVYVVDIDGAKLSVAETLGCIPINAREGDPVEAIRRETPRVDGAVEACGLPLTYRQSIEVVSDFGQVVLMGNMEGDLKMESDLVSSVLRRELVIHGTWGSRITPTGRDEWSVSLAAMDRTIKIGPILSHRVTLAETPTMLERMHGREMSHMRVAVVAGR